MASFSGHPHIHFCLHSQKEVEERCKTGERVLITMGVTSDGCEEGAQGEKAESKEV